MEERQPFFLLVGGADDTQFGKAGGHGVLFLLIVQVIQSPRIAIRGLGASTVVWKRSGSCVASTTAIKRRAARGCAAKLRFEPPVSAASAGRLTNNKKIPATAVRVQTDRGRRHASTAVHASAGASMM